MGIFDFFRRGSDQSDDNSSNDYIHDDSSSLSELEDRFFEFSNQYSFTVFVPILDEYGNYTDEEEEVNGSVEISADASWNSYEEGFEVSDYSWRDLTGRFDDVSGDIPDGDLIDEFYEDFRRHINSQGIDYKYIKF